MYKKERGNLYRCPSPPNKAFALPILPKRTTPNAHAEYVCGLGIPHFTEVHQGQPHITQTFTVALLLAGLEVAKFCWAKDKTLVNVFLHICQATRPRF